MSTPATDHEAEAVRAAADTFSEHLESGEMRPRILARLMLAAAHPHLIAAERERCAQQLARQGWATAANLLREETAPVLRRMQGD